MKSSDSSSSQTAKLRPSAVLDRCRGVGIAVSQEFKSVPGSMSLKSHLIIWPLTIMALVGLPSFVNSVSRNIGDVLLTRAMYPAKALLAIASVAYLIWAVREVWKALRIH
jgi:hypothetical protein